MSARMSVSDGVSLSPRRLYGALALAETTTWTLLLIGMVLKYVTKTTDLAVTIGGGLHGFVFLTYCAATVIIGLDRPWQIRRVVAGIGSAVVPYLTIPFERATRRRGLLAGTWRLADEQPRHLLERIAALVVRHPAWSVLLIAVVLAVVFIGLVSLGPPTEWGR